jgi:hypothetical protein
MTPEFVQPHEKDVIAIDQNSSQVAILKVPTKRRIADYGREAGRAMTSLERHLLLQHRLQTEDRRSPRT